MKKNIFEGAKYGDNFVCRNGTIAYYGRQYKEEGRRHVLMVQDEENDFISAYDDGHVFHIDTEWRNPRTGKTICETYGWNYEDMKDFRLDIVSRYQEPNDKAKLSYCHTCCNHRTYKDCECVCANFRNFCKAMEG